MEKNTTSNDTESTPKKKSSLSSHYREDKNDSGATPASQNGQPRDETSQLVQQIPIEGTPFTAIKYNDKWFLTLGKYRISELLDSLEAVQEDAKDASWIRVMQVINIMIQEDKISNPKPTNN